MLLDILLTVLITVMVALVGIMCMGAIAVILVFIDDVLLDGMLAEAIRGRLRKVLKRETQNGQE